MAVSSWSVVSHLNMADFVFSFLCVGIVNCKVVHPSPVVSYLVTSYLCWEASDLMLHPARRTSKQRNSDTDSEHTLGLPISCTLKEENQAVPRNSTRALQDTDRVALARCHANPFSMATPRILDLPSGPTPLDQATPSKRTGGKLQTSL
ncbi:hypothetical protein H8959_006247 [Pygathrix nigripes]